MANLFSHIIGQVDYDNYGISGIEKYFDKDLKDENLAGTPLELNVRYKYSTFDKQRIK